VISNVSPHMDPTWYAKVRRALERSWSEKTSYSYHPGDAPLSNGQCAPTAVVVFETFGGEILKTDNVSNISGLHFYNRIAGERFDFTADQFTEPLEYKDIPSNAIEAVALTCGRQMDEMRYAFQLAWNEEHVG
jgi:hypothetical protein